MIRRSCAAIAFVAAAATAVQAHDGPPFPILSDHRAGPYELSIWTDPDATDDGFAGGQFWVRLKGVRAPLPDGTRVTVAVKPLDHAGLALSAPAVPVRGDLSNQFAALVMDHEGPFAVRVTIAGPLGPATADAQVDATYNLRPTPFLVVLYVMPFVLAGILWGALMVRRRRVSGPATRHTL